MKRFVLSLLLAGLTLLPTALPAAGQSDPRRPAPWSGAGVDATNDGRAHTYYYRLPARVTGIDQAREVKVRVLSWGGTTTARLVNRAFPPLAPSVTYLTVAASPAAPGQQADVAQAARVAGIGPVLVVDVPADVTRWSVMIDDHLTYEAPQAPSPLVPPAGGTPPSDFPAMGPDEPGAQPWTGSFGGPFTSNGARYFYLNHPGGPLTIATSITAENGQITACLLDGPAGAEFDRAGTTASASSLYNNPVPTRRETAGPVTLSRGRYTLRVILNHIGRYSALVTTR